MELHERLSTSPPVIHASGPDPFAEVKNRIHLAVIGELGPQLFTTTIDPLALRDRVVGDIRNHLTQEAGISRDDRERLVSEISDDILGHGPLERLLADDSVTEIMVNGAFDIWVERQGRLYQTTVRFNDDSHLRRIMSPRSSRFLLNLRIVTIGPLSESGGMIALIREPSGRRASTIGDDSSIRRPTCATILLMIRLRCESSLKRTVV